MFENNIMEFFSRVHWTIPLFLYLPIISFFLYLASVHHHVATPTIVKYSLWGVIVWTLAEYSLHRFIFHYQPRTAWGEKIHWMFHGVHHDYPSDPLRLVMVPSISIPLASLFYLLFHGLMGPALVSAFMPGFLIGYLFYDVTHYAVHHFPLKGKVFGKLREHHLRHHFKYPDKGYGVSSPLWDVIFRSDYVK